MKTANKELFAEETNGFTIKDYLYKYLSYWPLFIISLLICVGSGILYVRYTEPKYLTSTLILVKNNGEQSTDDLIENAISGAGKNSVAIENLITTLTTTPLMERVVAKNSLNIFYYHAGKVKKTDIYLDAPFRLMPQTILDSSNSFTATIKGLSDEGGIIGYGDEKSPKEYPFKWNNSFKIGNKVFLLARKANYSYKKGEEYIVVWSPVKEVAASIASNLTVALTDKNTTILTLEYLSTNIAYAEDLLNGVFNEFNQSDIEDRNIITQNSIRFIDDRLGLISKELSGVEGNLESYQGREQIINVETQSNQSFENANDVSKDISNLNVQQGIVNMIRNYFNSPTSQDKLVPSTLGLEDPTLTALITRYNELQQRKQRESQLVAAGSTVMKDINDQLTDIRGSILESLQNLNKNLTFQERSLEQQNSHYRQFLSSLPRKERAMQEIKRKQGITEGLYLYLLQKREEAAISSTSGSISNYKQIEPAKGSGPVSPIEIYILMYTTLLGLCLPIAIVYLRDLFNDKVVTRSDITRKLQAPILGDVNHIPSEKRKGISVVGRDIISEQFRIIRTNLSILLAKKDKVIILVTSSAAGEGKSTISTNLAAVMSLAGKKVALLEFDLRKPVISDLLKVQSSKGLSDYLSGATSNIQDISTTLPGFPSLHVFPAGEIYSNPSDLLLNTKLEDLFSQLQKTYDYVIIDSAPTALVSDAFILAQYSDAVLYIIRQRKTLKKQMDFINEVTVSKRMKNISLIFNDVKTGGRFGYYGYGDTNGRGYESNGVKFKGRQEKTKALSQEV